MPDAGDYLYRCKATGAESVVRYVAHRHTPKVLPRGPHRYMLVGRLTPRFETVVRRLPAGKEQP